MGMPQNRMGMPGSGPLGGMPGGMMQSQTMMAAMQPRKRLTDDDRRCVHCMCLIHACHCMPLHATACHCMSLHVSDSCMCRRVG